MLAGRPDRNYWTLSEAAEHLGLSTKTLRRYISEGRLAAYRVGGREIRVRRDDVDSLLQRIPTAAAAA